MPLFQYKAASSSGEVLEGQMEAGNQEAVIKRLQAQGHIPIRAEEVARQTAPAHPRRALFRSRRVTRKDVTVLTLELSTLLQAGLNLNRALEILIELTSSEPVREVLSRVHSKVRGGAFLSAAMEAENAVFSRFYVNMVRAGEAGGALEHALARLAEFMERARDLRETIVSALIYPVILVFVSLLSLTLILTFVVPKFSEMFEDAGKELPLATQVVVAVGGFAEQYWWAAMLVALGLYFVGRAQYANPESRLAWDARLLRTPIAGELITKIDTARFTRTLGTLLASGVPLLNAVTIAKEVIGNQVIARAAMRVAESIRQGKGLAKPLMETQVFPDLAGHMLHVGEETGNLEDMLQRLADIYEREVKTLLQRIVALAEPVIILGLGLVIAGIIMSIVVAILGINDLAV